MLILSVNKNLVRQALSYYNGCCVKGLIFWGQRKFRNIYQVKLLIHNDPCLVKLVNVLLFNSQKKKKERKSPEIWKWLNKLRIKVTLQRTIKHI